MVSKFEVENLELNSKNLQTMLLVSKKQIAQAKAKLQEVMNQYKYLKMKAPNNGVIIQKNIKVGEMAMPGMPALILSDLSDIKIINKQAHKGFFELACTQLYPEGPFAGLSNNPPGLSKKIAVSLLSFDKKKVCNKIPDSGCFDWTIPQDYGSVHQCLKDLEIKPYDTCQLKLQKISVEIQTSVYPSGHSACFFGNNYHLYHKTKQENKGKEFRDRKITSYP